MCERSKISSKQFENLDAMSRRGMKLELSVGTLEDEYGSILPQWDFVRNLFVEEVGSCLERVYIICK